MNIESLSTTGKADVIDMLKDILQGDVNLLEDKRFANFDLEAIQGALDILRQADPSGYYSEDIEQNGWRLMYYRKPPTPEEFLTYEWIGPQAETLWPNLKKTFIEFMDPNPLCTYRNLALSVSIGWGKSLLSVLVLTYITVLFGMMREPYRLLKHSVTTSYAIVFCAATLNKSADLLYVPYEQLIENSPYFEKVGRHDDITQINREDRECKKCYYSTASRGSSKMTFRNNLTLKLMSTEGALLGNTIVACSMSEISWWEKSGWSREEIMTFFNKAVDRIGSRMNGHYLGRAIIDSSPFSLESPIDKFIWETAIHEPDWYCVTGSKWDWFPEQFPDFFDEKGNEIHNWDVAFQLYKGGKSDLPKALEGPGEAVNYSNADLIWCPKINIQPGKGKQFFYSMAKRSAIEFMRDWAGVPAGSADRIFQTDKELDCIFDNDLKNIYTSITADTSLPPEHLIWNLIKDRFWNKFLNDWVFYKNPQAPRAVCADASTTGDATCITMAHPEYITNEDGEMINIDVIDFTINIIPKGGAISLEALHSFIKDLRDLGGMSVKWVSFDKFQSDNITQNLRREGFFVDYVSADKNNEVYTQFIENVRLDRVACGRNLFLKNNLKSIITIVRKSGTWKYDHIIGKVVHESDCIDWNDSLIGINAKDCSDATAEACYLMNKHRDDFIPMNKFVRRQDKGKIQAHITENFEEKGWSFA